MPILQTQEGMRGGNGDKPKKWLQIKLSGPWARSPIPQHQVLMVSNEALGKK